MLSVCPRLKTALPVTIKAFGGDTAQPYVMEASPGVLSVGLRVRKFGYSFIWLNGKDPGMITPANCVIPLDVIGDIPYIKAGGAWTESGDQNLAAALTGVRFDESGQLVLDSDYLGQYFEAAGCEEIADPHLSGDIHAVKERGEGQVVSAGSGASSSDEHVRKLKRQKQQESINVEDNKDGDSEGSIEVPESEVEHDSEGEE